MKLSRAARAAGLAAAIAVLPIAACSSTTGGSGALAGTGAPVSATAAADTTTGGAESSVDTPDGSGPGGDAAGSSGRGGQVNGGQGHGGQGAGRQGHGRQGHGGQAGSADQFGGDRIDWSYSWGGMPGRLDFTSPSGNFACALVDYGAGAQGEAAKAVCQGETSPLPPRPGWCPDTTGWGGGMVVHTGGYATFLCVGDVETDVTAPALAYGDQISAYGFTCASHRDGVYCREDASGKGFMIASGDNAVW